MLGSSLLLSGRLLYAMPIAVLVLFALRLLYMWRASGFAVRTPGRGFYIGVLALLLWVPASLWLIPAPGSVGSDVEAVSMAQMMAGFRTANVMEESRRIGEAVAPLTLGLGREPPLLPFLLHLPLLLPGKPVSPGALLGFVHGASLLLGALLLLAAWLACRKAKTKRQPASLSLACFGLAFLLLTKIALLMAALVLAIWITRGKRDWIYEAVRREVAWLALLCLCLLPMLDVYRRAVLVPGPPSLSSETYGQSRSFLEKYPPAGTIVVSAHPAAFAILGYASLGYATFLQEWEAMMGSLGSDLHVLILQEQGAGKPLAGQELGGVPVTSMGESPLGSMRSIRFLELGK